MKFTKTNLDASCTTDCSRSLIRGRTDVSQTSSNTLLSAPKIKCKRLNDSAACFLTSSEGSRQCCWKQITLY